MDRSHQARGAGWHPLTPGQILQMTRQRWHGDLELTGACFPNTLSCPNIVLQQGYRHEGRKYVEGQWSPPSIAAAVTKRELFPTFRDLLNHLGPTVGLIIETHVRRRTSHGRDRRYFYRKAIDRVVLESALLDFEELLLTDGWTSIEVFDVRSNVGVALDEHKLLIVYAENLTPSERVFVARGVHPVENLRLIKDFCRLYGTDDTHYPLLKTLARRLHAKSV